MKDLHSDNELDHIFQEGLEGFEMKPSGKVWDNIEQKLDGKSRKPKFIFWLTALVGILLTGAAIVYFNFNETIVSNKNIANNTITSSSKTTETNNSNTSNTIEKDTLLTHNEISETDHLNTTNTVTATTENLNENNFSEKNTIEKNTTTTKANTTTTNAQNPVASSDAKVLKEKKENTKTKNNNNTPIKSAALINSNDSALIVTSIKPLKKIKSETASSNKNNVAKNNIPKNTNEETITKSTINENNIEQKNKAKEPEITNTVVTDNKVNTAPKTFEIPVRSIDSATVAKTTASTDTASTALIQNTDSTLIKKDSVIGANTDSTKNKISPPAVIPFSAVAISTYFSPDYFVAQISSTESSFNSGAESHNIRYSFGLKAEYRPIRMLGLQIGLAYSEISQQSSTQRIMFDKNISTPYSIFGSLGEMQIDPSVMKDGFSPLAPVPQFWVDMKYSQKVSFLNIPINAKLHFGKNKFSFTLIGGLNTQYAIKQRSQVTLIKEHFDNVVNYSDVKVNKLNYSALAGLGVEYKVAKHLSIYAEPNVRYAISNISKTSSISNKPIIVGVNTGVIFLIR